MKKRTRFLLFPSLALICAACSESRAGSVDPNPEPEVVSASLEAEPAPVIASDEVESVPSADEPALKEFQLALLEVAHEAASAMPEYPHIKTRSKFQEHVVEACLELGQIARAAEYADSIANWRTGLAHASIGLHLAETGGATEAIDRHLDLARRVVDEVRDETFIGWRRDRVRVRIAQAEFALGRVDEAARTAAGAESSELPAYHAARATRTDELDLDAELAGLESVAERGNYEQKLTGLAICTRLYERFYGEPEARGRIRATIDALWAKLPVLVRLDVRAELATAALEHEDRETALELLRASQAEFDEGKWLTENRLPASARLARLLVRAGDPAAARLELDGSMGVFDATRERVVNIYRADALTPVAEAYAALGDRALALEVFARALEEAVENPNSRPRAEDVVELCCTLARNAIDPGEELMGRIREIQAALGDPW